MLTKFINSAVRKKNTAYIVGDIVLHPSLPDGYCLACTIAGTSSNDELIFDTLIANREIVDNTVTWIILSFIPNLYYRPYNFSDFNAEMVPGFYFSGTKENAPINNDKGRWFNINLSSIGPNKSNFGYSSQIVTQADWPLGPKMYFRTKNSNNWTDWERIITDKNSGYRWPNASYTVGQIAYHSSLPTGWYLECTTAGTSDSGDLTITSPAIGGTVSDGTVMWTIYNEQQDLKQFSSMATNLDVCLKNGIYKYNPSTSNTPLANSHGSCITLFENSGQFESQVAVNIPPATGYPIRCQLWQRQRVNNIWTSWLQQDAIVAKSISANGYIKYVSGLLIQWGWKGVTRTETVVTFPITFNGNPMGVGSLGEIPSTGLVSVAAVVSRSVITLKTNANDDYARTVNWIAIGY